MTTLHLVFGDARSYGDRQIYAGSLEIPGDVALGEQMDLDLGGFAFRGILVHAGRLASPIREAIPPMLLVSPALPSADLVAHLKSLGFEKIDQNYAALSHISAHYAEVRIFTAERPDGRHVWARKQWVTKVAPVAGITSMRFGEDLEDLEAVSLLATQRASGTPLVAVLAERLTETEEEVLRFSGWTQLDYELCLDFDFESLIDITRYIETDYVWVLDAPLITGVKVQALLLPDYLEMLPSDVRSEYQAQLKVQTGLESNIFG